MVDKAKKAEQQPTSPPQEAESSFTIQRVYVKDLSFEAPNTPQIFLEEWKPQVEIEIQNKAQIVGVNTHEVILRIVVTARIKEQVVFLTEVQQAGIFTINISNQEQLGAIIGSFCPTILFPYAREAVASLINRGGFPPINLAPVNFDAAYQRHAQNATAPANAPDAETQH